MRHITIGEPESIAGAQQGELRSADLRTVIVWPERGAGLSPLVAGCDHCTSPSDLAGADMPLSYASSSRRQRFCNGEGSFRRPALCSPWIRGLSSTIGFRTLGLLIFEFCGGHAGRGTGRKGGGTAGRGEAPRRTPHAQPREKW